MMLNGCNSAPEDPIHSHGRQSPGSEDAPEQPEIADVLFRSRRLAFELSRNGHVDHVFWVLSACFAEMHIAMFFNRSKKCCRRVEA